uniref:tRNA-specific adenosine deaminase 2 n=1 Tax=Lygus hesperus TaxID=30085 RepID=A0A146KSV7_LYGHE
MEEFNEKWMKVAIELAEKALAQGEVPVGCIFVRGEEIIAKGRNDVNRTRNATRHAEMICIDEVFERFKTTDVFKEVTVVVTVEPCIMCAGALHDLGVRGVVFGCANDRFGGCGSVFDVAAVHHTPVPVHGGVFASKAMELLKTFYMGVNPNAPPSKVKTRKKTELSIN